MTGIHRLTAIAVRNHKPGKYCDGAGLYLIKGEVGRGNWIWRYLLCGKRREMGLGSIRTVSLKEARERADEWRAVLASGRDPIREREKRREESAASRITLEEVARICFEAKKAELKDGGRTGRWFSPIEIHVLPKLGARPVEDLTQNHIRDVLAPIWNTKDETARKTINRLSQIMRHGAAMGLDIDLQATDKAKALLGAQEKKTRHIAALPWAEVPAFYHGLRGGGMIELALRFVVLTACRSGEVRGARWAEIDLGNELWTIPRERMKGGKEHRVPLSDEAMILLNEVAPFEREGNVFPSQRRGVISDMGMSAWMGRHGYQARPHGFRSSFRDWCAEATETPREVAEACLAHTTGSKVERAYRRTDFLEKRYLLMQRWADHVTAKTSPFAKATHSA